VAINFPKALRKLLKISGPLQVEAAATSLEISPQKRREDIMILGHSFHAQTTNDQTQLLA
jgi:predicted phosphodiesterase